MAYLSAKINLSLICGLPASGKSTLSKLLCDVHPSSNFDMIILPIQFDDLLPPPTFDNKAFSSRQECLPQTNSDVVWKTARENICISIFLLMKLCANSYNKFFILDGADSIDIIQMFLRRYLNKSEHMFLSGDIDFDIACKYLSSIIISFSKIYHEFKIPEHPTEASFNDYFIAFIKWHQHLVESFPTNLRTLILLDDNFFYSSMRHEYYKIARSRMLY